MALKTSSGVWSTEKATVKSCLLMIHSPPMYRPRMSLRSRRRARRREGGELVLHRLDDAGAPAFGDGLGRRIRENVLVAFLHSVENGSRDRRWRGLRYLEA